jgi:hypothetical protein
MASLKQILDSLEKELAVVIKDPSRAARSGLCPQRLRLTLQFRIRSKGKKSASSEFEVDVMESSASPKTSASATAHTLEIEYVTHDAMLERSVSVTTSGQAAECQDRGEAPSEEAMEGLIQLLGAPGFDSSARATVVREVLGGLSRAQILQVAKNLDGAPHPELQGEVRRAWHRLSGVIRTRSFGSIGEGGQLVARLFDRYPPDQLLRWISERWQSQEKW